MYVGEITDYLNDIVHLGLSLVEITDGPILKEVKNNENSLHSKSIVVTESDKENVKIENAKLQRKKLFSPESTKRLTTNFNTKKENLPPSSIRNLTLKFVEEISLNDKQGPSVQVRKKNSELSSSNKNLACNIAKKIINSNKTGPNLQAQKKNPESSTSNKKLVYNVTGNKNVLSPIELSSPNKNLACYNVAKRIINSNKTGSNLQVQKKNRESHTSNKNLVYNITGNKNVPNAVKRISNNCSSKTGSILQVQKKNSESSSRSKKLVYNITGKKYVSNAVKRTSNRSSSKMEKPKTPERNSRLTNKLVTSQTSVQNKIPISPALKKLQDEVIRAIREKKTFTVCGNFHTLRRALTSRGWLEKMRILYKTNDREDLPELLTRSIPQLLRGLQHPQKGDLYRRLIITKLLQSHQVDFYWDQNRNAFRMCPDDVKYTLINYFKRSCHTSKQGLCEALKSAYWYQKSSVSLLRQPRTYRISDTEEFEDFIKDFKQTALVSLLQWVATSTECGRERMVSKEGKVPLRAYYFACKEVVKLLRKLNHHDIDCDIQEPKDHEWDHFLEDYCKIVHLGGHFKIDVLKNASEMQKTSTTLVKKLEEFFPTLNMDGMMNMWIMKPINGTQGQGIHLCRTLQYIFKTIKENPSRRYIIQKYIERPLLIYKTKFDIRQWFLISCALPLTMWIYKDCYIRFSSQLYNLQRLHESIHLTNNSVQHRYKNCTRNSNLPEFNMWDSTKFQEYLASIGFPTVYKEIIYPGMKECIIAAMLINQEKIDTRKNCFELYGCDFMLSEDFKPWLIEINSNPALFGSTPVTARLCPQVLEDLIKVMIDYRRNYRAPTGRFELLYRQKKEISRGIDENKLFLRGKKLPINYFCQDASDLSDNTVVPNSIDKHIS